VLYRIHFFDRRRGELAARWSLDRQELVDYFKSICKLAGTNSFWIDEVPLPSGRHELLALLNANANVGKSLKEAHFS
jgi:hypothetical protein